MVSTKYSYLIFRQSILIIETKKVTILVKGTIQQEEVTMTNIYAPNNAALNILKQVLLDIND